MNYIDILKIIEENSEFDKDLNKVVNENYFHKLAEDLNTLFAKRIVSCSIGKKREPILYTATPKQLEVVGGICERS